MADQGCVCGHIRPQHGVWQCWGQGCSCAGFTTSRDRHLLHGGQSWRACHEAAAEFEAGSRTPGGAE